MNALLKRNPDEEAANLIDSGISLELLHAIYDHLDDLVSAARLTSSHILSIDDCLSAMHVTLCYTNSKKGEAALNHLSSFPVLGKTLGKTIFAACSFFFPFCLCVRCIRYTDRL